MTGRGEDKVRDIIAGAPDAESAYPAVKRGRGRPPGSKNKTRGRDLNDVLMEDGIAAVAAVMANPTDGPSSPSDAFERARAHAEELFGVEAPYAGVASDAEPSPVDLKGVDPDAVAECAKLDQSDTDNGRRLIRHFGRDMVVTETENVASADWVIWAGDHWDAATGNDGALRLAQEVGGRIALEAPYLDHTPEEARLLSKASALKAKHPDTLSDGERETVEKAKALPLALDRRRSARKAFGVSSKNHARIINMLKLSAPHVTRKPDDFNADPNLTAVRNCTLRFVREVKTARELDIECPDPDVDRYIEREVTEARVEVIPGHRREDYITKLMPVDYDPTATAPRWLAFLEEYMPDPEVRRMVQVFSGLGMTGISLQRVLFHFGSGANGKSVFMETLMRLMGPLGADLPAASLAGETFASGAQASPDIALLHGARIVRVAELPANQPLKEDLVKQLTGGERLPVRNLFKGFFKFRPVFKAHLSGNGLPRIDGTDNGIWRRMVVAPWTVTIPEKKRRDLNIVVGEFVEEASGVLNWLVEGVLIYLREGFIIPEAAQRATQNYRDEMDPVGQFKDECIEKAPGRNVQASTLYEDYVSWAMANAKTPKNMNAFSKIMKTKLDWKKSSVIVYTDIRTHNVPDRPITHTGFAEER